MRDLLKKENEFTWTANHTQSLNMIKEKVCQAPTLGIFSSKKEVIVQADASQNGLGACLMQ